MTPERCKIREASLITGLDIRTLQEKAAAGEIPGAEKPFGRWTFDIAQLRGVCAASKPKPAYPDFEHIQALPYPRGGTVYFIRMGDGPIKIGWSYNAESRCRELQCASPFALAIVALIKGGPRQEAYLHEFFAEDRLRGEWFNPSPRLLALIKLLVAEAI